MSCPEVMYQYYPYIYQRPPPPHPHAAPHPSVAHAANPHTAHHSPARPAPFQPFSTAAPTHQYDRINVNQRSLETTGLELCGGSGGTPTATATAATATSAGVPPTGVVPQGQSSSAGSIGSAPSPASPRPAAPQQHRPPLTTSAQSSRNLDDDRSTDAVGPNTATDDSDDSESRAQYVSANCVVFTHYRGDAATEVEEHFQRALAQDKPKDNTNPMITRNFPASFWKSHHDVYEYTDPWHPHYTHYNPRAVHDYHHHHNMAASYNSLLLNRGLSHHPGSHHPTAMAAAHHSAAASYKDWTSAAAAGAPSQSLVDASSAPPYPHGPYAPLSSDYWT